MSDAPTILDTAKIDGDLDGVWEPVLPERHKAAKTADPVKLTVQKRAEAKAQEAFPLAWWFSSTTESEVSPWWSPARDLDLRAFWMKEGNDILAGAVSSMVKKFKAMSWEIEGPESVVKHFQEVLAQAEYGQGWGYFLSKLLTDYCTQDKGAFFEVIGEGKPDKPLEARAIGVANLDASLCQLTGDPTYPVLYWNVKDGLPHKLHTTRVVHLVDMPSPNENMLGVGFSAVSRVIASSQILLMLSQYKKEKLSDLPPAGLLTLSNIMPRQWEDQKAEYKRERRKLGQELWANVMTLFSLDPAQPASANLTSFASLPDAFNEREATDLYINIVALAFGVDVREFWPLSAGSLGTATETLVMHQKAKGKGVGEIISSVERAVNWAVLPKTCTFAFAFTDDDEDMASSQLLQIKTGTIMSMWTAGQDPAGGPAVVSREEVRQMLADNVSYFNESFLEEDVTDEQQATDTEAEESVDGETATDIEQDVPTRPKPAKTETTTPDETLEEEKAYGKKVVLDSQGRKVIRDRPKLRRTKPWIEEPVSGKQGEPVVPKGKPLPPWKGDIPITDEDIDKAISEWNEDVPAAAGLLEAMIEEPHG